MSWRASSAQSHWERLRPSVSGRSQARRTTWIATSGGKNALGPAARGVRQALEALGQKAPRPLANDGPLDADGLRHVGLEWPAASKRIIFPRRASPVATVDHHCQDWPAGGRLSSCWPRASQSAVAQAVGVQRTVVRKWAKRFLAQRLDGLSDAPGRGAKGGFPPEVAIHVVRLACERPDLLGRSLSQWDCTELARQLIAEGIVEDISAATVRRILAAIS